MKQAGNAMFLPDVLRRARIDVPSGRKVQTVAWVIADALAQCKASGPAMCHNLAHTANMVAEEMWSAIWAVHCHDKGGTRECTYHKPNDRGWCDTCGGASNTGERHYLMTFRVAMGNSGIASPHWITIWADGEIEAE